MAVNGYGMMGHPVYTRVTAFPLRSFKIFKQGLAKFLETARVLLG